ncbi:MAG: class I SAM-dependent methyltransferase [Alphaproteobacteria bacterium]|nr:class I SAM-dependent methyltransferase [Alphaproteobacteria bacterium]MCB9796245.1 class I SAM-dependent methyltransferase [Alphaproteobacteria bacterium]
MLYRPSPQPLHDAAPVDKSTPPAQAAARLRGGERLLVTDTYGAGAEILAALERSLPDPPQDAPYAQRRAASRARREAALRLLAPVEAGRVVLRDARPIGFLEELYPEAGRLALPLVELQSLHGAWRRYQEGVPMAVLGHALHPFYGTYVPKRTEHLELFATWLSRWAGPKRLAIDVGAGSGVLALMLARRGFGQVIATDLNPNAVESLRREFARRPRPVQPRHADLLEGVEEVADLIAFNPPWIQGEVEGPLDLALRFEPGLFERFFAQAEARLTPQGRVVMVFSNVIELLQPDAPHPIEAALEGGAWRVVEKLRRRVKGHGRRTRERVEVWELART